MSQWWAEVQQNWHTHVAKVSSDIDARKQEHDASRAARAEPTAPRMTRSPPSTSHWPPWRRPSTRCWTPAWPVSRPTTWRLPAAGRPEPRGAPRDRRSRQQPERRRWYRRGLDRHHVHLRIACSTRPTRDDLAFLGPLKATLSTEDDVLAVGLDVDATDVVDALVQARDVVIERIPGEIQLAEVLSKVSFDETQSGSRLSRWAEGWRPRWPPPSGPAHASAPSTATTPRPTSCSTLPSGRVGHGSQTSALRSLRLLPRPPANHGKTGRTGVNRGQEAKRP